MSDLPQSMIEVVHCPVCGQSEHSRFESVFDAGRSLSYEICEHCGLVYQSPRLDDATLTSLYEGEYRVIVQGAEGPAAKDIESQLKRAYVLERFTGGHLARVSRHLDVGCSSGALLAVLRSRYKCESVGIEPGVAYRAFARSKGYQVFATLDELAERRVDRFDLISLSHVLEHVPDPARELRRLREHFIAQDGYLLIEVPNLYEHPSLELTHLVAFSTETLLDALRMADFHAVRTQVHGGFRSKILGQYITVMARPEAGTISYMSPKRSTTVVRLKRRVGTAKVKWLLRLLPTLVWQARPTGDVPWPSLESLLMMTAFGSVAWQAAFV